MNARRAAAVTNGTESIICYLEHKLEYSLSTKIGSSYIGPSFIHFCYAHEFLEFHIYAFHLLFGGIACVSVKTK